MSDGFEFYSSRMVEIGQSQVYSALGGWTGASSNRLTSSASSSSSSSSTSSSTNSSSSGGVFGFGVVSSISASLFQEDTDKVNLPPFLDSLYERSYDASVFPKVNPLEGWKWLENDWTLDRSGVFGPCDSDGWMYGPSFDSILQSMKSRSACSNSSLRTSTKRHRRFLRTMICFSPEAIYRLKNELSALDAQKTAINRSISRRSDEATRLSAYNDQFRNSCKEFVSRLASAAISEMSTIAVYIQRIKKLKRLYSFRSSFDKDYVTSLASLKKYIASVGTTDIDYVESNNCTKFNDSSSGESKGLQSRSDTENIKSSNNNINNNNNDDKNNNNNNNNDDNNNYNNYSSKYSNKNDDNNYNLEGGISKPIRRSNPVSFDICQVLIESGQSFGLKVSEFAITVSNPLLDELDALSSQLDNTISSRRVCLREFVTRFKNCDLQILLSMKLFEASNIVKDECALQDISNIKEKLHVYQGNRSLNWLVGGKSRSGLGLGSDATSTTDDTSKGIKGKEKGRGEIVDYLTYRRTIREACLCLCNYIINSIQLTLITAKLYSKFDSLVQSSLQSFVAHNSRIWVSHGVLLCLSVQSILAQFSDNAISIDSISNIGDGDNNDNNNINNDNNTSNDNKSSNNNTHNSNNYTNNNDNSTSDSALSSSSTEAGPSHQGVPSIESLVLTWMQHAYDDRCSSNKHHRVVERRLSLDRSVDEVVAIAELACELTSRTPVFDALLQVDLEYSDIKSFRDAGGLIIDVDWHSGCIALSVESGVALTLLPSQASTEAPIFSIKIDETVNVYAVVNESTGIVGNCIVVEFLEGNKDKEATNADRRIGTSSSSSSSRVRSDNSSNRSISSSSSSNLFEPFDTNSYNSSGSGSGSSSNGVDGSRGGVVLYFGSETEASLWLAAMRAPLCRLQQVFDIDTPDSRSSCATSSNGGSSSNNNSTKSHSGYSIKEEDEANSDSTDAIAAEEVASKTLELEMTLINKIKSYRSHWRSVSMSSSNFLHGDLSKGANESVLLAVHETKARFES